MADMSRDERDNHTTNFQQLILSQQTLLLSTVSVQGQPESSYAPYVRDQQGNFYIFVSELAAHTKNMLNHQVASIMFIRSEHENPNLFARERVIFNCSVEEIEQENEYYAQQLSEMKEKFGGTVDLLASLSDFHLLALTPLNGRYIAGFGQAFNINIKHNVLEFKHQQ